MITVWKMIIVNMPYNHYQIDRAEHWTLVIDRTFDDVDEARDYVISKNLAQSELPRFLVSIKDDQPKQEVIDDYCFNNNSQYLRYRRYFLDKPSKQTMQIIRQQLIEDGIKIIHD